jgi:hypothetical protein
MVGENGIRIDPETVRAVKEWEEPKNIKEVEAL